MKFDGSNCDPQLFGDIVVAATFHKELQYFLAAGTEGTDRYFRDIPSDGYLKSSRCHGKGP